VLRVELDLPHLVLNLVHSKLDGFAELFAGSRRKFCPLEPPK
jgi:hypothetical protein